MTLNLHRRTLIRIISFSVAVLLVLILLAYNWYNDAQTARRSLEYRYLQSVADLTSYAQNIDSDLNKTMYARSPEMLASLSSKLWREAGFAKNALDSLPVDYLSLQNTNKFLSQVGDYCVSLSREFTSGAAVTQEQREKLNALAEYSDVMLSEVLALEDAVRTGSMSLARVESSAGSAFSQTEAPADIAEGFSEFEEGFTSYPSLIYDGPFSDHIMEQEPRHLKGEQEVSQEAAKERISSLLNISQELLANGEEENGKMPSYTFASDQIEVSATKQGGLISYLLRPRIPTERNISVQQALDSANAFLSLLELPEMKQTYYEITNEIITINFAATQDQAVLYPDLVKVGVAMDDGEILSFDGRGFLVNHSKRSNLTPTLSAEQARTSVSEYLTIEKEQLALIPSSGLNEVLCWEFQCLDENGQNVLVYVNAATGAEEQILILLIGENGQLTI